MCYELEPLTLTLLHILQPAVARTWPDSLSILLKINILLFRSHSLEISISVCKGFSALFTCWSRFVMGSDPIPQGSACETQRRHGSRVICFSNCAPCRLWLWRITGEMGRKLQWRRRSMVSNCTRKRISECCNRADTGDVLCYESL